MDETKVANLLKQAYDAAPPYVQNFIGSGDFDRFMAGMTAELRIHADIADAVSNEILLTLLGVNEPSALAGNLRKINGVSDELVGQIIEETNKTIFTPLAQSLRNSPQEALQKPTVKPVEPQESKWVPVTPPKPVAPVAPARPAQPFTPVAPPNVVLPGTMPPAPVPAPQMPPPPMYQPASSVHIYMQPGTTPTMQQPQAPQPAWQPAPPAPAVPNEPHATFGTMRTMGDDMKAVRSGQQPEPRVINIPQPVNPAPQIPDLSGPAPVQVSPQWSTPAPSEMPRPQAPAPQPAQYTRPYIPETPKQRIPPPMPRSGSNDPYREPVE